MHGSAYSWEFGIIFVLSSAPLGVCKQPGPSTPRQSVEDFTMRARTPPRGELLGQLCLQGPLQGCSEWIFAGIYEMLLSIPGFRQALGWIISHGKIHVTASANHFVSGSL